MYTINIRCYGELNEYLPASWQQGSFRMTVSYRITIIDILKMCQVPIDEIDLILVNGDAVDFNYQIESNDKLSIYPIFRSIDITPLNLINRGNVH
ncbi:MAG TPA: hypothetical protein EYQ42_00065 [Thiotrichaceae bacterium]|jgi:hypothetical protein|nr:hypothetical protein [Thiotrichaceae bacterium]